LPVFLLWLPDALIFLLSATPGTAFTLLLFGILTSV
jgi:hypothetical protein